MRGEVVTVAGLVTAVMTGFLPGVPSLTTQLYKFLFNLPIPIYLIYGFNSVFLIATIYNFASVLLLPVRCTINGENNRFIKPTIEDPLFYAVVYALYLAVLYTNNLLTIDTALVGVVTVLLPIGFRVTVYMADWILHAYKSLCRYPFYLFLTSMALVVPITVVILILIRFVQELV